MAGSSGEEEEEEEYEYEEIEVEEEEEEDEEEEEYEEVEEVVEPEEEPEVEEIEPEEEEEEYEEVVEEVEVTDDEEMEDEDTPPALEEDAVVADTAALEEEAVVEETEAKAKDDSVIGSSDLAIPTVHQPTHDVGQDETFKANEACLKPEPQDTLISEVVAPLNTHSKGNEVSLKSEPQDTVISEVADPLDTHSGEAVGSMLRSKSFILQNKKGKEVLSVNDGSSSPQDTVNFKVAAPFDIHAVKTVGSMLGSNSASQHNKKSEELLSVDNGSSSLPEGLKSASHPSTLGEKTVEREQGRVEKSTVPVPITAPATSEKHFSAPNSSHDHIMPTDTDETRVRSQNEDINLPSRENMDQKTSRYCTVQMTTHIDDTRIPSQKEDLHLPSIENMDQKALRHYTPQMRPRSLSPGAECEVVNKRSAMVCEYFLKGWCIKGSSCRFLHKRDQVDYTRGQVDGDMLSAKAEICSGSGDAAGSSKPLAHSRPKYFMTTSDDVSPNSTGGRYTEKDYREHVNGKDNFRIHDRDLPYPHLSISAQRSPSKDGSRVFSSQNEEEMNMFKGGRSSDHIDHHGSFSLSRSTLLDNYTHGGTSDAQMNYSVHSHAMVEESVAMRRQYTLDLHSSPIRDNGSVRNAFLPNNSSWKDMLISYKNERKFTPYNWEPSLPFRPSHYITSFTTSSSGVQYDPLRDSIEQRDIRRGSFRHSYGQDQSKSFRNSLESHKRLHSVHSDSNEKDNYIPDKDTRVVEGLEAESAAISATGGGNPMVGVSVKDVLKATKSTSDGNSKLKMNDLRHNGEMGKQINEIDDEETKVIKVFRAALIEYVKELMKPVWHEGRLSKDVYKVIVQKAEDKILSTLPSNEVPNTPETIKQYLSSSRPNILKLIQAYVDKYGKF